MAQRIVSFLVGLLLLTAGLLKLFGLQFAPVAGLGQVSPFIHAVLIFSEIGLGLWLWQGYYPRASQTIAIAVFALFSAFSLISVVQGDSSCHCFGSARVNPGWTLILDLFVIAGLLWIRIRAEHIADALIAPNMFAIRIVILAFCTFTAVVFLSAFLLPKSALCFLTGKPISVEPWLSNVGEGHEADGRAFHISLTNHSSDGIRILGGTVNCACDTTEELPTLIQPGQTKRITVHMRFLGSKGRRIQPILLYTDDSRQPVITVRVSRVLVDAKRP